MVTLYVWEGTLLYCGACQDAVAETTPGGLAVDDNCCCSSSSTLCQPCSGMGGIDPNNPCEETFPITPCGEAGGCIEYGFGNWQCTRKEVVDNLEDEGEIVCGEEGVPAPCGNGDPCWRIVCYPYGKDGNPIVDGKRWTSVRCYCG